MDGEKGILKGAGWGRPAHQGDMHGVGEYRLCGGGGRRKGESKVMEDTHFTCIPGKPLKDGVRDEALPALE